MFAQSPLVSLLFHEIITGCRTLIRRARDPYRPEIHYMRGSGPKWRAKHAGRKPT
jgi:hypothetical protein